MASFTELSVFIEEENGAFRRAMGRDFSLCFQYVLNSVKRGCRTPRNDIAAVSIGWNYDTFTGRGWFGWMSGFLRRSRVGVNGAVIGRRLSGKDPNRDSGSGRGPGFGRRRAGRVASLRVETRYRSPPPEQFSPPAAGV